MSNPSLAPTLFDEKSLGALLKVYESAFPQPLLSKALGGYAGILSFVALVSIWYFKGIDHETLERSAETLSSYSLTVSSALMGVVIAGMSIFAASLKPKVGQGLIEAPYPGTNISSLKFIFAMFAYVLFSLFLVIATCGVFYVALADASVLLNIAEGISGNAKNSGALTFLLVLYTSFLLGVTVFLGSLLKSFIWNLHQVLLVVAVFNGQNDAKK
mgnify:CR=1 FL=1